MRRLLGHALAGLAAVGATGMLASACSHNNSSIFVQDVLAPQLVSAGSTCTFTAQTTQPVLSYGVLDIDFRREYTPTYLIGNQLVPEVNSQQLQTETSVVNIQGAVVRVTDAAGNQLNTFTRLAAATLYPSSGGVPGYAPIQLTTIDETSLLNDPDIISNVVQKPASQASIVRLVTYVQFFGQTTGGLNVESGFFEFPVDVCKGCLIGFSSSDVDSNCSPIPNCRKAEDNSSSMMTLQLPCYPGQDLEVDCSLCLGIPDCAPPVTCMVGSE